MARRPKVVRTLPALDTALKTFRRERAHVALVPTMGALHTGHLALVKLAKKHAKRVVVSIFVNPAQFGPQEDLARYPRTWDQDIAALTRQGVDVVWAPTVEVMYPEGFATGIVPRGAATVGLEDQFRPHFFAGVATVVAKLFLQCRPNVAIFGEKDFQQLKVVTQLARDLDLPLKVIGAPTTREKDGLAMSSRNAYLSPEERKIAAVLYGTLTACAKEINGGAKIASALAAGRKVIKDAGFEIDYLDVRRADTLMPATSANDGPLRLLVAARLGKTRLIDNIAV